MGDGAGREAKNQTKAGVIEVMEYRKATRRGERRKIRRALSDCDQRDVTRYVAIPLVLAYVAMATWLLVWTAGRIA